MAEGKSKRYNLILPQHMFNDVEQLAKGEKITVIEVMKRSVRLGLLIFKTQKSGGTVIIRENGRDNEIYFL